MAINVYITVADVSERMGGGWWTDVSPERSVMLANLWLTSRGVVFGGEVPDAVKQAGAELAVLAGSGKLYADKQVGLLAETVQADSVSVSQSFSASAKLITAEMQIIEALIKPYIGIAGSNPFVVPLVRM
ncbi:hypothetical protein PL75_03255 [Neisseria arctica]|uniref:Protein singed n=1 Tax=Neisseria arctica TaxID=1470200 RepID=A0A0J0YT20_9NEIS|nr:hypothetical protein [Neisseria arctica]KLT73257.1 hypothetical protein PL75_03255 [Neisseria arctica]UOO87489.1 hypothetical protein LVJ86_04390 [Neisseria arctica]